MRFSFVQIHSFYSLYSFKDRTEVTELILSFELLNNDVTRVRVVMYTSVKYYQLNLRSSCYY